jgi:guanine deaminase
LATTFQKQTIPARQIWRGAMLHSLDAKALEFYSDGALMISAQGSIDYFGPWESAPTANLNLITASQAAPEAQISNETCVLHTLEPTALLMPGMIDCHVHLPQTAVAGKPATDLLDWLNLHIFKEEARFNDPVYAKRASDWFFEELLANGTTTSAVFLTSHPEAVNIAFETALEKGNRVVMGQNLMDFDSPEELSRPTQTLLKETEELCKRWHQTDNDRLQYAWIPRFALSCSNELMAGLGELRKRYPDVYLHTHLSEQQGELAAVAERFPDHADYSSVYESFNLLKERSILAHAIHLSSQELSLIKEHNCSLAHCPSSNFFLKSGRFKWFEILERDIRFGLGSDVGAGPELSIFKVMHSAQLQQCDTWIESAALIYAATLGGAKALHQDDRIGNFETGKEADFIVLNLNAKAATQRTFESKPTTGEDWLSRCIYLGDDRLVQETYIRGKKVYCKS